MSATQPTDSPDPVPDRVAVETPRGTVRTGDVISVHDAACAETGLQRTYSVDVGGGCPLRVSEANAEPVVDVP
jgi:hypothetical protein